MSRLDGSGRNNRDIAPEVERARVTEATTALGALLRSAIESGAERDFSVQIEGSAERPLVYLPDSAPIDNGPPPERRQTASRLDDQRRAAFKDALVSFLNQTDPRPAFDHYAVADLDAISCRWPVSGEGAATLHCGRDSVGGAPYCTRHCRLAYAPRNGSRAS